MFPQNNNTCWLGDNLIFFSPKKVAIISKYCSLEDVPQARGWGFPQLHRNDLDFHFHGGNAQENKIHLASDWLMLEVSHSKWQKI